MQWGICTKRVKENERRLKERISSLASCKVRFYFPVQIVKCLQWVLKQLKCPWTLEDLANKFVFKNHMQKKELWLFLDKPISDKLFSHLSSTDSKLDSLLTLYSTFIPNLSWCGVRVQAQIPAEIGEEADVISIHTRHPGHFCVKGKHSRDSITHCCGDILLPVLLTPLVSGQGPVKLKAQCSPAPTWMPSCKTASYRATPRASSQVPCSTQSALLFP